MQPHASVFIVFQPNHVERRIDPDAASGEDFRSPVQPMAFGADVMSLLAVAGYQSGGLAVVAALESRFAATGEGFDHVARQPARAAGREAGHAAQELAALELDHQGRKELVRLGGRRIHAQLITVTPISAK